MPFPDRPGPRDGSRSQELRALPFMTVVLVATALLFLGLGRGRSVQAAGGRGGPEAFEAARSVARVHALPSDRASGALAPIDARPDLREVFDELVPRAGDEGEAAAPQMEETVPTLPTSFGWPGHSRLRSVSPAEEQDANIGVLRERGTYRDGARHGAWEFLRPDGSREAAGQYVDGRRDGQWERWSQAGVLVESTQYQGGVLHGDWRAYSDLGDLIGSGEYSENLRSGRWVLYYTSGRVKEAGLFVDGLREGPWEFFDDLGQPTVRTGTYRAGIKLP